ncbi:MAG: hypothetical protein RMJ98_00055 [Myxococcales bacterium]|nr:hypothetical protein [Polyangiaceae bacterium]MDW8247678.1 hypothetical protein [Myxococcales bacterium]
MSLRPFLSLLSRFSSAQTASLGLLGASLLLSTASCFDTDQGLPPPERRFYFPTGVAVSPGGKALFVINSDFDLQYRAGTAQALDLRRLRAMVNRLRSPFVGEAGAPLDTSGVDCQAGGLGTNSSSDSLLYPGPCAPIDLDAPPDHQGSLIRASVDIGAFGADVQVVRRPPSPGETTTEARLLIPVRGDPSLTWLTIDDDTGDGIQSFRLDCGQGSGRRCSDAHRAGTDRTTNLRDLTLPEEPFELAVNERTDAVLVTHQTSGAVSLLLNGWSSGDPGLLTRCAKLPPSPVLSFVLGGLPSGVTGTAALPMPRLATLYPEEIPYAPAFLVSYRNAAQIDVIRYYDDCLSAPARPFLTLTGRSGITTNAGGFDSRSIAVDPSLRKSCEAACADSDKECLAGCAGVPVDIYVANRTPPSLLVGKATGSVSQLGVNDSVFFGTTIPLAQGASRVRLGHIVDTRGAKRPRAFILCFDARLLYVYDPEAAAIEAVITTGRGPSAIAFDPGIGTPDGASNYAYLAHFTDSYLAVLDLDMRHPATYLTFIASVGIPTPPRES